MHHADLIPAFEALAGEHDHDFWTLVVHNLAWRRTPGSALRGGREIWHVFEYPKYNTLWLRAPYDADRFRQHVESYQGGPPACWSGGEPPFDHFFSVLPIDIYRASDYAIDLLLESADGGSGEVIEGTIPAGTTGRRAGKDAQVLGPQGDESEGWIVGSRAKLNYACGVTANYSRYLEHQKMGGGRGSSRCGGLASKASRYVTTISIGTRKSKRYLRPRENRMYRNRIPRSSPDSSEGGMTKTYRDWSTDQTYLFPPSPHDWLPQGDLVSFLLDTVATLDLTPIFAHDERELPGQPPLHPRMMVALLLDCYATGTRSSRRIMKRCHVDVACRVIVGEDIPDFRTISDFRKIHLARLETLFVEVLKLWALAGLAKVGTIALDGTKVKANASRHKAMSYDRMKAEEARLKEEIAKLLADAQATDDAEDLQHGPDRHGDELPEELARRQSRLAKIQQARTLLEERAWAEAAEEAARRQAEDRAAPQVASADAVPGPKDQINFTDPESRIMRASNKVWDQCGNAQAVVNKHQIILAVDVTDQANDTRQVVPMADQARANLDAAGVKDAIEAMLGDAGYYSEANATSLEGRGIKPYLATERLKHSEKVAAAPRGRIPAGRSAKQRMARKLRTKRGREMDAQRKGMIEPVFGQLKQVLGFRQFSLRGLASMRGEWRLMATVHNLLKLWRSGHEVAMAG